MDRSYIDDNRKARERLRSIVDRLTDEQLSSPLGEDWTVAVALAHLAFWDQRSRVLLRKWKSTGVVQPSPIDIDITNEALLAQWHALVPRKAAALAVSSAEAVDRELETVSDEILAQLEAVEDKTRLFRSFHRKMHLDQIEESLKK